MARGRAVLAPPTASSSSSSTASTAVSSPLNAHADARRKLAVEKLKSKRSVIDSHASDVKVKLAHWVRPYVRFAKEFFSKPYDVGVVSERAWTAARAMAEALTEGTDDDQDRLEPSERDKDDAEFDYID